MNCTLEEKGASTILLHYGPKASKNLRYLECWVGPNRKFFGKHYSKLGVWKRGLVRLGEDFGDSARVFLRVFSVFYFISIIILHLCKGLKSNFADLRK